MQRIDFNYYTEVNGEEISASHSIKRDDFICYETAVRAFARFLRNCGWEVTDENILEDTNDHFDGE